MNVNQIGLGVLRQPTIVYFGPGQRALIPQVVSAVGSRVLLCTDERMATTDVFGEITAALSDEGLTVSVYAKVEPDLPRENLVTLMSALGDREQDVVVGLGGGSCLDFAKVAALLLARGGDVRDLYGENLIAGPGLPVVTVPTTGGTGAEATCISVVYDAEKEMKLGVASAYLEPYAAVIDPELTLTCPPTLTAATGADALSHLVESFTARAKNPTTEQIRRHLYVGKNVLADLYARNGLTLLGTSLEKVAASPDDLPARADTMLGAFCAGMAICTAGTAAAHAIQSPMGAITHTPHGLGVGALLPYVMRYNLPTRQAEMAEIGRLLGAPAQSDDPLAQARAGILRVEEILAALGVPLNLRDLGLEPSMFEFVAAQSVLATRLLANNPRELTHDAVLQILRRGYDDDRSWTEF
ncbi:iron-containing alcohol dehydrogenase [Micromonospora sp. WMMD558]|uniref:iron-containing alcohol dehydrogenase n=1 Tax=Micromonospora sp. WMMD558 TaxID=3403462 RepID=UPI003BF5408F